MIKIILFALVLTGYAFYRVNEVVEDTYKFIGSAIALKSRGSIFSDFRTLIITGISSST